MTLTAGDHLGSYEIISATGTGDMRDVYRARCEAVIVYFTMRGNTCACASRVTQGLDRSALIKARGQAAWMSAPGCDAVTRR